MSPTREPSVCRVGAPSRLLLGIVLVTTAIILPADAGLFQAGPWEGEYWPAGLGDNIDASFCVERDDASSPPWKVNMRLDLDPPGNARVDFKQLEITDQTLRFRIDLLNAPRDCVLQNRGEDELRFECKLIDGDPNKTDLITMRKAIPRPDGDCQLESTDDTDPEPSNPDQS